MQIRPLTVLLAGTLLGAATGALACGELLKGEMVSMERDFGTPATRPSAPRG